MWLFLEAYEGWDSLAARCISRETRNFPTGSHWRKLSMGGITRHAYECINPQRFPYFGLCSSVTKCQVALSEFQVLLCTEVNLKGDFIIAAFELGVIVSQVEVQKIFFCMALRIPEMKVICLSAENFYIILLLKYKNSKE